MRPSPPPAAGRMPELDGLRAIAISLVLVYHTLVACPLPVVRRLTGIGWCGVDLFFVLSGFLIGGILLDNRGATNYYRVFYLRRFFRIVPLYAAVLAPAVLAIGLGLQSRFKGHSLAGCGWTIWFFPLFLQNIAGALLMEAPRYLGPAWSLAVEEQFYLLLPPLVRCWPVSRLVKVMLAAVLAAPLIRVALLLGVGPKAATACYELLPCRWDALLLGVLCACAMRTASARAWLTGRLKWLRAGWMVLAAGMGVMTAAGWGHLHPVIASVGYSWNALFFTATLLLATLNRRGAFCRGLSHPAFKPVATVSYGLYLLNGPGAAIVEPLFRRLHYAPVSWTATGVASLGLAATIVAAILSWRLFESRLLALGHRFRYAQPVPPEPDAQAPAVAAAQG